MHKINLSVTATRTDVDRQFKGVITFKNEHNDEVSFEYLCTNPKDKQVDIIFSNKDENFHVKGLPSKELLEALKENQRWIFALSINLLSSTIENSEKMLLSHETTQVMRMFRADASGKMSGACEVEEKGYQIVFGNEISENKKLEEIHTETDIRLTHLKRAKYSTFPEWVPGCTLEEAENAYVTAPEEGEEKDDKTLLRIVKKIIELRSRTETS